MNSREELALKKEQEAYRRMEMPEALEQSIRQGIKKGKIQQKQSRRKRNWLAVAVSLLLFFTSLRISPAFAALVEKVPGLSYLIELIQYDQGLKKAVENDFYQVVNRSQVQEEIEFTVQNIIVDESQMLIFYSIEDFQNRGGMNLERVELLDEKGVPLAAGLAFSMDPDKNPYKEGMIQVAFGEQVSVPESVTLKVRLAQMLGDSPDSEIELASAWEIPFEIDHDKFKNMKQVYEVNQTLEIEGQNITVERLTQYPTKITVEYSLDPNNTMAIFGFYGLGIANEKGMISGTASGFHAGTIKENSYIINLESRYFENPSEIYLQADGIYGLEKTLTKVTLDLEQQAILGSHDSDMGLLEVNTLIEEEVLELVFGLRTDDTKKVVMPFSGTFVDRNGKEFQTTGMGGGAYAAEPFNSTIRYTIPLNQGVQSPVTLEIVNYPKVIEAPLQIKIK